MTDAIVFTSIGALGAGFSEDSLDRGIERGSSFIGADAGSVDGGPFALAGQGMNFPESACRRDLVALLRGARRANIPLLVGSCGSSGRDWGVDLFVGMVREAAKEHGLRFKLARIYSELPADLVAARVAGGRVHAIETGSSL